VKNYEIRAGADPLKRIVVLKLSKDFQGRDYHPMSNIIHAFAKANDCYMERIYREKDELTFEVLIKKRLGPEMAFNPFFTKEKK
jgi:hypothetical protein